MSLLFNSLNICEKDQEDGFALTELIVVIVIIGILAAIAMPMYFNNRKLAIDAQTISNAKNMALAADKFFYENPSDIVLESKIINQAGTDIDIKQRVFVNKYHKGYCILSWNPSGLKYTTKETALTLDSNNGGLHTWSEGCEYSKP